MTHTIKIRGIDLYYDDLGEGKVLVLIHGQPFNRTMWEYQSIFQKDFRLIIPDLRGYGDSGLPDPRGPGEGGPDPRVPEMILLDELALDIIHLLEALGIARAVFIGLSMGGQVALEIFRLKPGLFRGLVLADTDARAENEDSYVHRIRLSEKIREEGMEKFTDERIHLFLCQHTLEDRPAVVSHLRTMMLSTPAAGSAAVQRGRAERRDHSEALATIHFPTLLVVGEEDGFTPVGVAEHMHRRIRDARLAVIPDAGHIPSMERPDLFNEALAVYLTSIEDHE